MGLLILVLLLVGIGSSAFGGRKLSAGNWAYVVTKTEARKTVTWSDGKADAKGTWFLVYLTLINIGKQDFGIAAQDFALADGRGVTYAADIGATPEYAGSLNLTALRVAEQHPPGVPVQTLIMFDIDPATSGLSLVLLQTPDAAIRLGK